MNSLIETLCNPRAAPSEIAAANAALLQAEESAAAWSAYTSYLTAGDCAPAFALFCAQGVHRKLLRDSSQLSSFADLRARLPALLDRAVAAGNGPLAAALANCFAVALIVSNDVPAPVATLFDLIKGFASGAYMFVLVMERLPAELASDRLRLSPIRCQAVSAHITKECATVFGALNSTLLANAGKVDVQLAVLRCVRTWVPKAKLTAQMFVSCPILMACFDALLQPQLFKTAVDCVCEMLHGIKRIASRNKEFAVPIFEKLGKLKDSVMDEDVVRLYTEVGECFAGFFASNPDIAVPFANILARAAAGPDRDVAMQALPFFMALNKAILFNCGLDDTGAFGPFRDVFVSATNSALTLMKLPDDYESLPSDEQEEADTSREQLLLGTVRAGYSAIGSTPVTQQIVAYFQREAQAFQASGSWQGLEAALFAFRGILELLKTESDPSVAYQLLDVLPSVPQVPILQRTAISVIGECGFWLRQRPQQALSMLSYITTCLGQPVLVSTATKTFHYLCLELSDQLLQQANDLVTLFIQCMTSQQVSTSDLENVSQGVGAVVGRLSSDELLSKLTALCTPFITTLSTSGLPIDQYKMSLKILSIILLHIKPSSETENFSCPAVMLCTAQWPAIKQFFAVADEQLTETLCGFIRNVVTASGDMMTSELLREIVLCCCQRFTMSPDECVVVLLVDIVEILAKGGDKFHEMLFEAFCLVTQKIFGIFAPSVTIPAANAPIPADVPFIAVNQTAVVEDTSLVHAFMALASSVLSFIPFRFYSSPVPLCVVVLALSALPYSMEYKTIEAMLHFVERFFIGLRDARFMNVMRPAYNRLVVLTVHMILVCAGGALPMSTIPELRSTLAVIRQMSPNECYASVVLCLGGTPGQMCPGGAFPYHPAAEHIAEFANVVRDSEGQLIGALLAFGQACRCADK